MNKILLANEATKILHGEPALNDKAKITAKKIFRFERLGEGLPEIMVRLEELR